MNRITVTEKERGLLFRSGRFVRTLGPGRYLAAGARVIETFPTDGPVCPACCSASVLRKDPSFAAGTVTAEVRDGELGLHFVDGNFAGVLTPGTWVFFTANEVHTFRTVDRTVPAVEEDIPRQIFEHMPGEFYTRITVPEAMKARLYLDGRFDRLLEPGTYYFWNSEKEIDWQYADTRWQQLDINGQEMLTADKVTLRINFVVNYRITDFVKIAREIADHEEQLRAAAQLALREYVGRHKLDEILDDREALSSFVRDALAAKAPDYFLEIRDAGVKDIILPGEIRDIMNTVLLAEKKAQANVITRREEVASTRSLLNTAKLMEENKTLYRLKEMEYAERICENVSNLTLNGNGSVLEQLAGLIHSEK